jgi:hypothetical protein
MKKSEYWKSVRNFRAENRGEHGVRLDTDSLAEYAHEFWKQNDALPVDLMPNPAQNETSGDVLRKLWDLGFFIDPKFLEAVLHAYEMYFVVEPDSWYHIKTSRLGAFSSDLKASQLRKILKSAIVNCVGFLQGSEQIKAGLYFLCHEYVNLKCSENQADLDLFEGTEIQTLISEYLSRADAPEILHVLESFIPGLTGPRTTLTEVKSRDAEKDCFNKDLRPMLVGKFISVAKTFSDWHHVYRHSQNHDEKVLAIYHLQDRCRIPEQAAILFRAAKELELNSVKCGAFQLWQDMCTKATPEKLIGLANDSVLNKVILQKIILQKCED